MSSSACSPRLRCEFHKSSVQFLGFVVSEGKLAMDPAKTKAINDWPSPSNWKEHQRFLRFANFYRRFIRNYSSVANPLTTLTSTKTLFVWIPEAAKAFSALKNRFTSAFTLVMPDPERQFILEVDASDMGVGAILLQRASDNKVHPCAFFSRHLTPAENNYAVGDRKFLALKLALEEWRHLLEGSMLPFIVWTDHKNLEYVLIAKHLNPRQSRWSLLFNRFNFTLAYRPGSKNVKPNALSRLYSSAQSDDEPTTILPPKTLLAAAHLDIVAKVVEALGSTRPVNTPSGQTVSEMKR